MTRKINVNGEQMTIQEASKRFGVNTNTIRSRLFRGKSETEAATAACWYIHPGERSEDWSNKNIKFFVSDEMHEWIKEQANLSNMSISNYMRNVIQKMMG